MSSFKLQQISEEYGDTKEESLEIETISSDSRGAAGQIRTADLILTNRLIGVQTVINSCFGRFFVRPGVMNQQVVSGVFMGSFRGVGQRVGQGSMPNSAVISASSMIRRLGLSAFASIASTRLAMATSMKRSISMPRSSKNSDGASSSRAPTP